MKHKRLIWIFGTIILVIIGFLIIDQWRTTTYGTVLEDIIPEDEEIKEVEILRMDIDREKDTTIEHEELVLENNDDIMKLTEGLSDMELKKTRQRNTTQYYVTFTTASKEYVTVQVDIDQTLKVDGKYNYQIAGNNELVETIESYEDKWKVAK